MTHPTIIQGGMGVAISTWELANAVSRHGQLGVISGTGIAIILLARLMRGDIDGHTRRALAQFPQQDVVQRILDKYFVEGGVPEGSGYKRPTMWTVTPPAELEELTVVANFVEVWLAKEGHDHPVGINLLEKVQMPTMASLYGAMLAGVDVVIMGAGIPIQIPGILDQLAEHQAVKYRLDVVGHTDDEDTYIHFDPQRSFAETTQTVGTLKRPAFYPIISSVVLAKALLKRATGEINGFVIEMPTAGGHNAPPRKKGNFNEAGEPIYTDKDAVKVESIAAMGLPFWLAGGYGHPDRLQEALDLGAQGVQVGTAFAFCDEAGMTEAVKHQVIRAAQAGTVRVFTDPKASPTGFPFKVVQLDHTVAAEDVYQARQRVCDIGYLRQLYRDENGKLLYRCASEPIKAYLRKGGTMEETVGRKCLCNHLGAAAGFAQVRKGDYVEPEIVTSGDDLVNLADFVPEGQDHYSAADVLARLLEAIEEPVVS